MRKEILFITGSDHKVCEVQQTVGDGFVIIASNLEGLTEIQSLDIHEVVEHKLDEAVRVLNPSDGTYVMVEDTALIVDIMNGLPGPFIKFFHSQVGSDAVYRMARALMDGPKEEIRAHACNVIGLWDGQQKHFFVGKLHGHLVPNTFSVGQGWGFDPIFFPDGFDQTLTGLGLEIKTQTSHRALATKQFVEYLNNDRSGAVG